MTYEPRRVRPAPVGPLACLVILRHMGDQLETLARGLEASPIEGNRAAARELRTSVHWMRQTAAEVQRALVGSAVGTSEPGGGGAAAESGVSSSWDHLTVVQVAERLQVSSEYVRRLCRTEGLSATRSGRDWVIDAESVAAFEVSRRQVS